MEQGGGSHYTNHGKVQDDLAATIEHVRRLLELQEREQQRHDNALKQRQQDFLDKVRSLNTISEQQEKILEAREKLLSEQENRLAGQVRDMEKVQDQRLADNVRDMAKLQDQQLQSLQAQHEFDIKTISEENERLKKALISTQNALRTTQHRLQTIEEAKTTRESGSISIRTESGQKPLLPPPITVPPQRRPPDDLPSSSDLLQQFERGKARMSI